MTIDLYFIHGSDCPELTKEVHLLTEKDLAIKQIYLEHRQFIGQKEKDGFIDGMNFSGINWLIVNEEIFKKLQLIENPPQYDELIQKFIEEHYVNHPMSNEIAQEGDLHKLIFSFEEVELDDCSYDILVSLCPEIDRTNWKTWKNIPCCVNTIESNYYQLRCEILEQSIVNSINNSNN